ARGAGELVLGGYRGDHPLTGALSDIFSRAGWNVRIGTDMKKEVWKKALINIGINAVTAINRVANGDILANADLRETAVAAVREAGLVATALGSLSPEEVDAGVERMLEVCRATSANRSSMLQDVENHRQTEIDALNGAIVRWGEELSIATPVNLELVQRVKRIAGV
ncbi:ketopantoate reductase family protein, partial [Effusibacillus lacus]